MAARLPFRLPDVGLREISGFVYLDDEFLVIDVRSKLIGIMDEQRQVIKVAPTALEDAYLAPGLFHHRLVLHPRRLELLEAVPGEHAGELALKVKRKHRRLAESLARQLEDWMA